MDWNINPRKRRRPPNLRKRAAQLKREQREERLEMAKMLRDLAEEFERGE